ncbi:MAG TPA: lipoyl synthase [Phycisphaerales bacterium]|nr:lipoyl synthase [Phycisphaerales bacterium]HIB00710.1 lipoyl synthase [Phycisphaerales bacterium]HIB51184.1 lipoyl synthase [Phycisphaerales bacterium]HIN84765.1 lipoyl synthase [Phycisphaerales bacterium]HIO53150.1 lipoyl synthase [Phycisphaerales bacterium]
MQRKPPWIRAQIPGGDAYLAMRENMKVHGLNTVCQEASCPNIGDCWTRGTATIMILGDICTRSCGFCNVRTGKPNPPDYDEPENVGKSIALMGLRHIVITCVDRDDLPDGGAQIWAETIEAVHRLAPETSVEALIGDFKGDKGDLATVIAAKPEILAHNLETVPRMHGAVRPQATYERSMQVLKRISDAGLVCKTGIMVGIGETDEEISTLLADIRDKSNAEIITIGQYLQPSRNHLPIDRWVHPDQFAKYKEVGLKLGFRVVESGPLVRSSYHAEEQVREFELNRK